jgi:heme a synthase
MTESPHNRWLHRFAVLTALATLALIAIGGLVTSHDAGMSVPDWPNSYGYNMFFFPPSKWIGGILYEHTHRLWASMVGLLIVALARWLGGREARRPLAIVGALEMLGGIAIFARWPEQKATGGFLMGVGGVILLAALVWVRNKRSAAPLPQLGWLALALVQIQGLLGGLRVVLFKDQIGIFHATLAQLFFVLTCAIALLTSGWWLRRERRAPARLENGARANSLPAERMPGAPLSLLFLATTTLILFQLILGATMRHQHAGLSIPDFPLAYGKLWPATDPASLAVYNERRIEVTSIKPVTAFQIELQMVHRVVALLILGAVGLCAWKVRRSRFSRPGKPPEDGTPDLMRRLAYAWVGLIVVQAGLGAATILSDKAADIATAHVLVGALSLATGALLSIIALRFFQCAPGNVPAEVILKGASAADLRGTMEIGSAGKMPAAR